MQLMANNIFLLAFFSNFTKNILMFLFSYVCTSIHISYMFMSLHVHVLYMTNVKITFEFQNVIQNLSISIYKFNMIHAILIFKVNHSTNNWCNLPWQFLLGLFSSWSRLACSLSKTVSFETTMCWWHMLQNQFIFINYLKLFRVL